MPKQTLPTPGVLRWVLGQQLRDLRQQASFTFKMAGSVLDWSEPKLWRIETGQTALRVLDVQAMCAAYDAPAGTTRVLAGLAAQIRADDSWRAYGEAIRGNSGVYTVLEDTACGLTVYAPSQIPGLLRTEAYARALVTSPGLGEEEADRLVSLCLKRRVLVTRTGEPLEVTVALDEALVRRSVCEPEVMAGQLRFLADLAALPTICVRVVPYDAGRHPGLATGAFTMLHFPPTNDGVDTDPAVVYIQGLTGELYLDKPDEVQRYRDAYAAILDCALDEHATQALLMAAAKDLEQ